MYELQVCNSELRDEADKGPIGTVRIEMCDAALTHLMRGVPARWNDTQSVSALIEGRYFGLTVLQSRPVPAADALDECRLRIKALLLTVEGVTRENRAMRKLLDDNDRKKRGRGR